MEFLRAATDPPRSDRSAVRARAAVPRRNLVIMGLLALLAGVGLFELVGGERPQSRGLARAPGALGHGLSSLPLPAQGMVSAVLGARSAAYQVRAAGAGFEAQNPAQGLRVRFSRSGVQVRSADAEAALGLAAIGYGSSLERVRAASPTARANRVAYTHTGVSEWYANGPLGLEQGFAVSRPPAGRAGGPLTLSMAISANVQLSLAKGAQSIVARLGGKPVLRYTGLTATDAGGRALRSWLALEDGRLVLRVAARGARYPLRIDPFIQQGGQLTGADSSSTVALSADGNTALIGTGLGTGTAYVFTRSGETWTQQAELSFTEEEGEGDFGAAVALSADGNTALIGAPGDDNHVGAAWAFTRSEGVWTQQGSKITGGGESGKASFGYSVALSAEGNTAVIGAPADGEARAGAAWVFTRSEEGWTQQREKLTSSEPLEVEEFGASVALSGDGSTSVIGAPEAEREEGGRAWVFTRSEGAWASAQELTSGGGAEAAFGFSVALSAEGTTALIGAPKASGAYPEQGAAYTFARSGETWTQQG